jgi:hypothetical protein
MFFMIDWITRKGRAACHGDQSPAGDPIDVAARGNKQRGADSEQPKESGLLLLRPRTLPPGPFTQDQEQNLDAEASLEPGSLLAIPRYYLAGGSMLTHRRAMFNGPFVPTTARVVSRQTRGAGRLEVG